MINSQALWAELKKNRRSRITWITFVAFAVAPVMGGIFVIILRNPELIAKSNVLSAKAKIMSFYPDWNSYLSLLTQAIGVGGVLAFGFVGSWMFGREFSEGTSKDLLSLPTSRRTILNAKFVTYVIWCISLAVSNLVIGFLIGWLLGLDGLNSDLTFSNLRTYFITTVLAIMIGTPVAFFAVAGEGYLAPLGFVVMTLVVAQVVAATGFGNYFPWSIPGLYGGAAGEYRNELNWLSYSLLSLVTIAGYFGTTIWFQYSDQNK